VGRIHGHYPGVVRLQLVEGRGVCGAAIIASVFVRVLAGHLVGATFTFLGVTGLPAALIASTGPVLFAAVFVLAFLAFISAFEQCIEDWEWDFYSYPYPGSP
jgi:hypothetical protein